MGARMRRDDRGILQPGLAQDGAGLGFEIEIGQPVVDQVDRQRAAVQRAVIARFGGPEIPWWVGALGCVVLIATLGYFNIDVSVRVLVWIMLLEVALVLVFDLAVFARGGAEGVSLASFNVARFTGPQAWVGFLFAILVFIGFEATVLYRDEVKDPDRTIPRATYLSVLVIGALYTFSVWMLVTAFGSKAQEVANHNLAGMFTEGASRFVGTWFADTVNVLLLTAVIAALLSIHNASTRYIFNLGNDGGLPRVLGAVHPKFRSPYRASLASTVVSTVVVAAFAVTGSDPNFTYAATAGLGSTGIIVLMVLVSVVVIVGVRSNTKGPGENLWKTLVAPLASAAFLLALTIYALANYYLVVGGSPGQLDWLLLILLIPLVAGLVVGPVLRAIRPAQYLRIGGYDREE